jgi:hypothetical protein
VWGSGWVRCLQQCCHRPQGEGAHAEGGGGVEELLTVHVFQLHYRATAVDESQRGVGGDTQDRPEGFSIYFTRPANFAAFELADIITILWWWSHTQALTSSASSCRDRQSSGHVSEAVRSRAARS